MGRGGDNQRLGSALQVPLPMGPGGSDLIRGLREHVEFDAVAAGVVHATSPQPDELLACAGWSAHTVDRWCGREHAADLLWRQAQQAGFASGNHNEYPGVWGHDSALHLMVHAIPANLAERRWCWLQVARARAAFTLIELHMAGLILARWHHAFHHGDDLHLGRLIVGHDQRVIHADAGFRIATLTRPAMLTELLDLFEAIRPQRWPTLADDRPRDFIAELAGEMYWVCFRRGCAVDHPRAGHWMFDLRRIDRDDLPAIGAVEDVRIARGIAFIHEHFHEAPSLATIAAAAGVSAFHFHRLFTRAAGISPKNYHQRKQLQVAKWLLRHSRTPIGTLAASAGFSSHGHFTSTFHRIVGVSPTQYRERP